MRFLLGEVARRLRFFASFLQELHPTSQRLRDRLQRFDAPVCRPVRPREQPPNPGGDASQGRADQLRRKRRKGNLVHEASMRGRESYDTHANGAYIIGMTRFPPPPAGMFETTVLFGHTSTVAPSDVPSVFSSG